MADLDDFFAKKDKKKSKSKPKFLTAEELVKNLEDNSKKEVAAKVLPKKPEVTVDSGSAVVSNATTTASVAASDGENNTKVVEQPVEEEWGDFEKEQRKDYSGLKIAQLTINDEKQQSRAITDEEEGDSEDNANTDIESLKRSGHGPWKKLIPAEDVTQIPVEIEKSTKVYISPALRQSQGIGTGVRPTRNRAAPDITNAEFFPTLNAARPEEQRKKKNEPAFEEVRHGGRVQRVQEQITAPTAATNRFQSLDDEADS